MKSSGYLAQGRLVAERVRRSDRYRELLSRVLQVSFSAALVILLSPVMLAVALLILIQDGRPIIYGHYRVGRDGQLFKCLKFRTMVRDSQARLEELLSRDPVARAEWDRDRKLSDDPRITSIGRFLRRTSLDELPQLFNVIAGDMLLVGPRPITVAELEKYGGVRWHYLNVMPGVTGLWQVSGRSDVSYAERVELDRQYVERRTPWDDFMILLRTIKVVLRRDGAS